MGQQGSVSSGLSSGVDDHMNNFRQMFVKKVDDSKECENLLVKYLQKCAKQGGVLDRTDLQTFYDCELEDFITPSVKFAENRCDIRVDATGNVAKIDPANPPLPPDEENGFPKIIKSKFTTPAVVCDEDKAKVRILLATEGAGVGSGASENDFHKVWRGDGTKIVDMILTIMRTLGLDSFKMVACRELIRVDYDKVEVLEDWKDVADSNRKKWIIIGFNWAVIKYIKIVPDRDLILDLCAEVFAGTTTKAKLLRNTTKLPPNCKAEFLEYTGPGDEIDFKIYSAAKARKAHERMYTVKVFPDATSWSDDKAMKDALKLCERCTIKDCVTKILDALKSASAEPANWILLLAWEPLKVSTYEEYMHQVYQMRVRGNPEGSLETAMQCIDYLNTKCQASLQMSGTTKKAAWLPAMTRRDIDTLFTAGRTRMDRFATEYSSGNLGLERFQLQFEKACMRMVTFCDIVLIPFSQRSKSGDIDMVDINKTKADFLRQLCCWCPKYAHKDKDAREAYALALQLRTTATSHWSHSVLSTYVNSAHFAAECWRDRQEAIRICLSGKDFVTENCEKRPNERPSPASTMTWNLLESNLKAYRSWLVIMLIRFDETSMKQHAGCPAKKEVTKTNDMPETDAAMESAMNLCSLDIMDRRMCSAFDRICHLSARPAPIKNEEVAKEVAASDEEGQGTRNDRAVNSWLNARPLCSTFFKHLYDVRWVGQAEKYDPASVKDLVHKLEEKAQKKADDEKLRTERDSARAQPATAERNESVISSAASDDYTYLCAALITPRWLPDTSKRMDISDTRTRLGLSDIGWAVETDADITRELKAGPAGARDVREPIIKVSNLKPAEWNKLLNAMDDQGVIQPVPGSDTRTCPHCGFDFQERMPLCMQCHTPRSDYYVKIAGQALYPGDRLMQPGGERPDGVTIEQIKNKEVKSMNFYSSMKVESVTFLCHGAYVDNHEFFTGFVDGHQNLKFQPSESYHSLHALSLRVANVHKELREANIPARKITCMSARRDQIEAAGRGCK